MLFLLYMLFLLVDGADFSPYLLFPLGLTYGYILIVYFNEYPAFLKKSVQSKDEAQAHQYYKEAMRYKFLGLWGLVVGLPAYIPWVWMEWRNYTQKNHALEKEAVRKLYQHHFVGDDEQLDRPVIVERSHDTPLPMSVGDDGELFTREELKQK